MTDDEKVTQGSRDFFAVEPGDEIGVGAVQGDLGFERRAEEFGVTRIFEHLVHRVANLQEGIPELDLIGIDRGPGTGSRRPSGDEDGDGVAGFVVRQRLKRLFSHVRGERGDGGDQSLDDGRNHGLTRPALDVVLFANVQLVLAHVQVHVGQERGEGGDGRDDAAVLVRLVRRLDLLHRRIQAAKNVLLERRQRLVRHALGWLEIVQHAHQEANRSSEFAVRLARLLDDVHTDAHITRVIRARHPQS